MGDRLWRFSTYCQPQVRLARRRLWPSNMADGKDRLTYLEGMVEYANLLLDRTREDGPEHIPLEQVIHCIHQIPFASRFLEIVETDEGLRAQVESGAISQVAFDPNRLGIALLDGRNRAEQSTAYLETGQATASYARLISALQRGASREQLSRIETQEGFANDALLRDFLARGLVEEVDSNDCRAAERFMTGKGDRLTWLGHAAAMVRSQATTVWIDPYLTPRIEWQPEDRRTLFSPDFAESRLFEQYGPETPHWPIHDLPAPEAVLITHQDCDHLDLGVLMALPEKTSIVVSRSSNGRPWEVNIKSLIRRVLGSKRKVITLAHGKSLQIGSMEITAFPFRGEMPASLPHEWNCYLIKTANAAVAFTADSRLDEEGISFLVHEMKRHRKPLTLCAGTPSPVDIMPGWREGLASTNLWSSERLWGWYAPVWTLFQPTPCSNLNYGQLEQLAARARLRYYFPYAKGSAPWFRIQDPMDSFYLPVSSLEASELEDIESELRALTPEVSLFPGRYGVPTRIDGS